MKKHIYGVYFICCLGKNYIHIVDEQLELLHTSGLYNQIKKMTLFICLFDEETNNELLPLLNKYDPDDKFIQIKTSLNLYEKFAINNYKYYIEDTDYYIFYFHTKGVSYDSNEVFSLRRKILNFYIIQKFQLSLKLLDKYDVVGCSLTLYPKLHFSGNFWWSKSEHTNKLSNVNDGYYAPEMYICSSNKGKYISLNQNTNFSELEEHIFKTDEDILNEIIENVFNVIYSNKNLIDEC